MKGSGASVVSIHPYFKVHAGKLDEFKSLLADFVAKTKTEEKCLCYDFSIQNDEVIHCRESYIGAEGVLTHLDNVGEILGKALAISDLLRLEFHGPAAELEKLKEPLADLNPDWFEFETGV
ncbi:antibiotic biosynthesis monooxygenase [Haloferula helveola]|uniref:Antibiotic biosynthesis monooxygenase n=1 Tax=Haloferula helveola TaxID=490095 RepID=A0ABM7RII0_9BACT|nr:antibiotic biosynthesis monooxygenase [Haloferula helveola]